MITAVVLDMDGLLIDTEPVWRTAEKEVFAELGIELTEADVLDTTGVRVDRVPGDAVDLEAGADDHAV
ncbi:MAG TPA: hypothetical protein VJ418_12715, partial [Streptosporangiaceae bacterium]|nr:hypothetical protein [Streptosporangiaceae bacterium]